MTKSPTLGLDGANVTLVVGRPGSVGTGGGLTRMAADWESAVWRSLPMEVANTQTVVAGVPYKNGEAAGAV